MLPSITFQVPHCRHGTGPHFVTQRHSDPRIQGPGDPVDPVTLFYNELQMSTYVADKRLQWARGSPVFIAVWRLHASGTYKKLSYRQVTARCVLSVVILPIITQQCRNYLYDKS